MQNLSNESDFVLPENEHVRGIHYHMNGFARRLVLTQETANVTITAQILARSLANFSRQ